MIKAQETILHGCFLILPKVHSDNRGVFLESYNRQEFERVLGFGVDFVQDNLSVSNKNVLRGLHYQRGPHSQAKLIQVIRGRVTDVVVDLRKHSPTFGRQLKLELTSENRQMLFIPRGMAHGFLCHEDNTVFMYKCDNYYHPEAESGILFSDPDLDIDWGIPHSDLILSNKDRQLPTIKELM
jgi:dTDP-4-dehydrorhamnose 3,5-epimerase